MRRRRDAIARVMCLVLLAVALLALSSGTAAACVIDNKASLFANGVQATLNPAAPNPSASSPWARFTIDKAFASAAPVHLSELRSDLVRSLSPAMLAAPYRWEFGDGASVLGHAVAHRYARAGLYRLLVYGYSKATRSWSLFDTALVRIVAPDEVLWANLGYYALRALDIVMSGLMWLIDAVLVALVLYVVVHQRRRRKAAPSPVPGQPQELHR